jgi:hypothetical protein
MVEGEGAQSRLRVRLSLQSSELAPHRPLRGGTHSLAGEGRGKPMQTKGYTLWYSSIIPLRGRGKEEASHPYPSLDKNKDDFFHVHLFDAVGVELLQYLASPGPPSR